MNAGISITEGMLDHSGKADTATFYVKGAVSENVDNSWNCEATDKASIKANSDITIDSDTRITLVNGRSKVVMQASGAIALRGSKITIIGTDEVGSRAPRPASRGVPRPVSVPGTSRSRRTRRGGCKWRRHQLVGDWHARDSRAGG